MKDDLSESYSLKEFTAGKSAHSISLLRHFIEAFGRLAAVRVIPAKTMIGIATDRKRVAYMTRIGKDFILVVFPFTKPHHDNLCFEKIAQVPGDARQYNHHLRLKETADINDEVRRFIKLAYEEGS